MTGAAGTERLAARTNQIVQQILFVDGLSGAGKTMVAPILSSFQRVEVQRMDAIHECVCQLHFLGRIPEDGAVALVRTFADLALYNAMIGRETNFRWRDLSGVLSNPGGLRYLARLLQPDGDQVLDRIARLRPILQIHAHQVLGIAQPLLQAFGSSLRMIRMVRHPLFLLRNYRPWMAQLGIHPRDFTVCFEFNGAPIPWYARGHEELYLKSNPMDRTIHVIDWLTGLAEETLRSLEPATRAQVLAVPFEHFVTDPWPYLGRIEALLGTRAGSGTARVLRKQKIPRRIAAQGRDHAIYRRYGWEPGGRGARDESDEVSRRWQGVRGEATPEAIEVLERLCRAYEEEYQVHLAGETA